MNRHERRARGEAAAPLPTAPGPQLEALFADGLRLQQAGRMAEAEDLYRRVLVVDPEHVDCLHMSGLLATQMGRPQRGLELLKRTVDLRPDLAEVQVSLGITLRALGRHEDALAAFRRCSELKPDLASAHVNSGVVLKELGRPAEAVAAYRRALELRPNDGDTWINLGATLSELGRFEEALAACRKGLELRPQSASGRFHLGYALQGLGRFEEAGAAYRGALALRPDGANAHNNLGVTLKALGRDAEALAEYRRAIELKPSYAEAHNNLGALLQDQGRSQDALACFRRAIDLRPGFVEAYNNATIALNDLGRLDEALAASRRASAIKPDDATACNNTSIVLQAMGRSEEAIAACQRAIELRPDDANALNNLGTALKDLGRNDEALQAFDRAAALGVPGFAGPLTNKASLLLELGQSAASAAALDEALRLDPRSGHSWHLRSESKTFQAGDPDIDAMERLLASASTDGMRMQERINLEFALSKAWFDAGDPARAFEHLNSANRHKRATLAYDAQAMSEWLAAIAEVFEPQWMAGLAGAGDPSPLPVFVIGMPRSGTSLVEQILASHPEVHGAGELRALQLLAEGLPAGPSGAKGYPRNAAGLTRGDLPALGQRYLQRLQAGAPPRRRIIDKMPTNFCYAGLAHLILPNARIIHCMRDGADSCFSCYTKNFRHGLGFAFDLRELGAFYRDYERLMDHWRRVLPPDRFAEVRYEELVEDLEGQSRRLVEFCGLAWDDACLRFYENERQVRTASVNQVRRPLYHSSVGRWRRYEEQLRPLLEALGR